MPRSENKTLLSLQFNTEDDVRKFLKKHKNTLSIVNKLPIVATNGKSYEIRDIRMLHPDSAEKLKITFITQSGENKTLKEVYAELNARQQDTNRKNAFELVHNKPLGEILQKINQNVSKSKYLFKTPLDCGTCPITHDELTNPVITSKMQSYDGHAIYAWFKSWPNKDPANPANSLPKQHVLPNHALQDLLAVSVKGVMAFRKYLRNIMAKILSGTADASQLQHLDETLATVDNQVQELDKKIFAILNTLDKELKSIENASEPYKKIVKNSKNIGVDLWTDSNFRRLYDSDLNFQAACHKAYLDYPDFDVSPGTQVKIAVTTALMAINLYYVDPSFTTIPFNFFTLAEIYILHRISLQPVLRNQARIDSINHILNQFDDRIAPISKTIKAVQTIKAALVDTPEKTISYNNKLRLFALANRINTNDTTDNEKKIDHYKSSGNLKK